MAYAPGGASACQGCFLSSWDDGQALVRGRQTLSAHPVTPVGVVEGLANRGVGWHRPPAIYFPPRNSRTASPNALPMLHIVLTLPR